MYPQKIFQNGEQHQSLKPGSLKKSISVGKEGGKTTLGEMEKKFPGFHLRKWLNIASRELIGNVFHLFNMKHTWDILINVYVHNMEKIKQATQEKKTPCLLPFIFYIKLHIIDGDINKAGRVFIVRFRETVVSKTRLCFNI